MRIPNRVRYRTVRYFEFRPAWPARVIFRAGLLLALILMLAPWRAVREVGLGRGAKSNDLKAAGRATLWLWNRSRIPLKFPLGTFFDIGWVLSAATCDRLSTRKFLSTHPVLGKCDRAQLMLSSVREGVDAGDADRVQSADREIVRLVESIFAEADEMASSSSAAAPPESPTASSAPRRHGPSFDNAATRQALLDFDDLCRQLGQRYFLVSGTFLGVVRDGGFIGHDHDIDVGVFADELLPLLPARLRASEYFQVTRLESIYLREAGPDGPVYRVLEPPAIIKLVHCSGVAIDVFIHFRDGDVDWHGSGVQRWDNARFELAGYEFLERTFNGPKDFDRYLTENYGSDWRIPKVKFDSNLDTPNMQVVRSANSLVFWAWLVARAAVAGEAPKVRRYLELLESIDVLERRAGRLRVVDGREPMSPKKLG